MSTRESNAVAKPGDREMDLTRVFDAPRVQGMSSEPEAEHPQSIWVSGKKILILRDEAPLLSV